MTDILDDFDAEYEEPEITRRCKIASDLLWIECEGVAEKWFDKYQDMLDALDTAGCNDVKWWKGKLKEATEIILEHVPGVAKELDEADDTEASVLADTRR